MLVLRVDVEFEFNLAEFCSELYISVYTTIYSCCCCCLKGQACFRVTGSGPGHIRGRGSNFALPFHLHTKHCAAHWDRPCPLTVVYKESIRALTITVMFLLFATIGYGQS